MIAMWIVWLVSLFVGLAIPTVILYGAFGQPLPLAHPVIVCLMGLSVGIIVGTLLNWLFLYGVYSGS